VRDKLRCLEGVGLELLTLYRMGVGDGKCLVAGRNFVVSLTAAQRERWIKAGGAMLAFALVALAWHFGTRQSGGMTAVTARRKMPELALAELDGGTWRMEDHRGQVVLINYWATWCGPCREEMPGLVRLAGELGAKGFAVVGVSLDVGSREGVRRFVKEYRVPYPIAFPEEMSQMAQGMAGVPTTILVDREGRVAKTYVGAVQERDFREDVEKLLEQDNR
jgi:cytochrome c biogenesis protein CcmG/thiol:disulfide interchange protein DsbE